VRVFERWQDLETFVPSWEELSRNALEPSPSAEPWMLMPALRCALPGNKVRVVLVSGSAKDGQPVLCGVFPIEERPRYRGLPARTVRLWAHIYTLFPAPLLRQDRAVECLGAFFDWIRTEYPANTLVEFPELRANSGFFRLLSETLLKGSLTTLATGVHVRAFFRPKADHERYLGSVGTPHHRHEWRRQERRLSEKGTLAYAALDAQQDLGKWIDAFIALEMTGWKGREGTAFGSNPSHRAWLDEVARSAAERGRLMMLALELDGRPVAMKLNILCPPGSYAFKIAYDESLAKFSPGVLLELENIKRLHSDPALEWMDSLAAPGHSLMDRVWPDRTAIVSLLVAPGPWMGRLLLSSVPLLRMLKQGLTRRAAERREGAGQA
jgi:CelD/BcsL family acetyltransferase involved in cellulose biosynthesis